MSSPLSADWRNYLIAGLISLAAVLVILLFQGGAKEGFFLFHAAVRAAG